MESLRSMAAEAKHALGMGAGEKQATASATCNKCGTAECTCESASKPGLMAKIKGATKGMRAKAAAAFNLNKYGSGPTEEDMRELAPELKKPLEQLLELRKHAFDCLKSGNVSLAEANKLAARLDSWEQKNRNKDGIFGGNLAQNKIPAGQAVLASFLNETHELHEQMLNLLPEEEIASVSESGCGCEKGSNCACPPGQCSCPGATHEGVAKKQPAMGSKEESSGSSMMSS